MKYSPSYGYPIEENKLMTPILYTFIWKENNWNEKRTRRQGGTEAKKIRRKEANGF